MTFDDSVDRRLRSLIRLFSSDCLCGLPSPAPSAMGTVARRGHTEPERNLHDRSVSLPPATTVS